MLGTLSVLSFCYRDLFARWEIRTEQPSMSFHYVTVGRGECNTPISLSFCFLYVQMHEAPNELFLCFLEIIYLIPKVPLSVPSLNCKVNVPLQLVQ